MAVDSELSRVLITDRPDEVLGYISQSVNQGVYNYTVAIHEVLADEHDPVTASIEEPHLQLLGRRESKRLRGSLIVLGYKLEGGTDDEMIGQAAVAGEVNQVAITPVDDIQDDSAKRRGMQPPHRLLADLYRKNTGNKAGSDKTGESLATNVSIGMLYDAQEIMGQLDVPAERRIRALSIMNQSMRITGRGQNLDIWNSKTPPACESDIRRVMLAKTAIYSVVAPLQIGLTLANAPESKLEAIRPFGENIGIAFQILNDLDVMQARTPELPKDPSEDIRGGKQTLLTHFALMHPDSRASSRDQKFLARRLHSDRLSDRQFAKCQRILLSSGAAGYAHAEIEKHAKAAMDSLEESANLWNPNAVNVLRFITHAIAAKT